SAQRHHRLAGGDDDGGGVHGAGRRHEVPGVTLVRLQIADERGVDLVPPVAAARRTGGATSGTTALEGSIAACVTARATAKGTGAGWRATARTDLAVAGASCATEAAESSACLGGRPGSRDGSIGLVDHRVRGPRRRGRQQ